MSETTKFYSEKFKLTDEQTLIYAWLKNQGINTDDGTLCHWAKTYSPKRIREVVEFAKARMNQGQTILNIGGWIHKLLKSGNAVVNDTCMFNQKYAVEYTRARNWSELHIYEKYVKDSVTGDDLPLTIATDEFKRSLERLYEKSQLYGCVKRDIAL